MRLPRTLFPALQTRVQAEFMMPRSDIDSWIARQELLYGYQPKPESEVQRLLNLEREQQDALFEGRRGRRPVRSMVLYYDCHRAGTRGLKVSSDDLGTTRHKHDNLPCDCNARIRMHCKQETPNLVHVTYHFEHNDHTPASIDDLPFVPLQRSIRQL
ncbi:hypothetical protein BC940DRAFT_370625 [Gongronella butleri]|nr:hypothetical protein BC940DRAFT_370625 [Gongronella butleri]